ncbi:hypothetical protein H0S70_06985 [Chryseobacterium manosquense]|uniref:Uncharacterized protein n=1 Tax=Chryseobacterium manosquense TaxID=2754694 RepID=A0A7H1DT44_9FLAO|nr:hypothetical protein [Chryseobacterium manosquense]QNS40152.1 hypothetical protein H0S70_06985 [Chryseobacterium manosquense]
MNTTIKQKLGICTDCNDGKQKPLTAKRYLFHYQKFRAEQNAWKKEKRAEMNGFLNEKKKPKPIPKMSKKRQQEIREYTIKRLQFLAQPENLKCPITGERATEIHHMRGRIGSLLLDTRYWLAVSRNGHRRIEENPEWAKENNYSLNRI